VTLTGLAPRWLELDGAVNARAVLSGVLLRSDNLQSLTERDLRVLVDDEAVEVVLDLRTDVEVTLEGLGPMTREPRVRIEHRSLYPDSGGHTDFELDTLKPWRRLRDEGEMAEPPVVRAYVSYLRRRPDSIVGSVRAIARSERAVLVHCAAGKDRTGVVVAVALDAAGIDRRAVVADYLASGERIRAIMSRLLASPTYRAELEGQDPAGLAPRQGTMERLLEIVDRDFGGSGEWLLAQGLEPTDLERLRSRLRPAGGQAAVA
jgi:hypothetical protein